MKEYRVEQQDVMIETSFSCDRCGEELSDNEMQRQEAWSITTEGGFASVFGDLATVSIDLCQGCVSEVLGKWLRIS